jgi:hypothetical protein
VRVALIALFGWLISANAMFADSIAFRLGGIAPRIESDLWEDNLVTFEIERADFDGLVAGVELAIELNEFVDVIAGVESTSHTVFSNYRDFVRDDGTEIIQDISLRVTPLTFGVRFLPIGKFHRVYPYVSGGAGVYFYEYIEEGEFIDFDTFDVFGDVFVDRGASFGAFVAGGVELGLTRSVSMFGEYRRHWARGEHDDDFVGFGDFDLRAHQASFGVHLRF